MQGKNGLYLNSRLKTPRNFCSVT